MHGAPSSEEEVRGEGARSPEDQLIDCAAAGQLEELVRLIDVQGVDKNYRGQDGPQRGATAVHCASMSSKGDTKVVRALLARGADPDIANVFTWTPAMHASMRGHVEVVQLLTIRGADVKAVARDGATARSWA